MLYDDVTKCTSIDPIFMSLSSRCDSKVRLCLTEKPATKTPADSGDSGPADS